MFLRKSAGVLLIYALLVPVAAFGQTAVARPYEAPADVLAKIKEEGTKNSQIMKTMSYLTDVIGPRLTGSPGMKRANEWTRDQLKSYGLVNAQLEPWGPFGRGWTLKKFYANVDGPTAFPMIAYPKAWSPGTDTLFPGKRNGSNPYTAEVVRFNPQNEAELEPFKGKLKGKIILMGAMREIPAHFEPEAKRHTDKQLLDLADAPDPNAPRRPGAGPGGNPNFGQNQQFSAARRLRFLHEEGAAIIIDAGRGDGGTIFVGGASMVTPAAGPTPTAPGALPMNVRNKAAIVPIQISAAAEHFNRVSRMIEAGEKVTMTVDLAVEFQDEDLMSYNTVAEIPGTDKADEVVMLGGHLDSWHSGTGATDNAAGCAVMMEAARIINTLGLKPRRTIRVALWSGEEQGLIGSREYVTKHFGSVVPPAGGGGPGAGGPGGGGGNNNAGPPKVNKLPAYDKFSAYYNIDNGTGKIRGVYMQGNDNVRSVFRTWLQAFRNPKWYDENAKFDMSAFTLSLANTGGTDHQSFDRIGLPGFQFIQDAVEYDTRTHHSNMDVYDRIQADDMKQMAIILATFVYQTAMMDELMPRKDAVIP